MSTTIPHIFIVNLADATQRRAHMSKSLDALSLEYEFVEAVDGKLLSADRVKEVYDEPVAVNDFGRNLSRAEIGCYLSHVKIFQMIVEREIPVALVLEDDVYLMPDLKLFLQCLDKLPHDCQLVQLSQSLPDSHYKNIFWYRKSWKIYNDYKVSFPYPVMYGTQGYIITNALAKEFIHFAYPIIVPIDVRLFDLHFSVSKYYSFRGKPLVKHAQTMTDAPEFKSIIDADENRFISQVEFTKKGKRIDLLMKSQYAFIRKLYHCKVYCFICLLRIIVYLFPPHKHASKPTIKYTEFFSSKIAKLRFFASLYLRF